MVLRVEVTQAKPTELELTLGALHEFAAFTSHNHNFARRAHLSKHNFVEITVSITVIHRF